MHSIADPALLTAQQRDLIIAAAANRGECRVKVSSRARGRAVWSGKTVFCDPSDPEAARRYLCAVRELVKLRFLRAAGAREQYELSNSGWQMSRKLPRRGRSTGR